MHGGDLTRSTFDPTQHFSGVRMQQGRVQLDADWNEQLDIADRRDRADVVDTVGPAGAPKAHGGFRVAVVDDGTDLLISPGRMWVDGTMCEIAAEVVSAEPVGDRVSLATLLLDGRSLAVHDWVELTGGDGSTWTTRLRAVETPARTVTLAATPPAPLTAPVRLRRVSSYTTQPDLPEAPHTTRPDAASPPVLAAPDGTYLAYLDVWQRSVGALEAPHIREQALGGPDTTTRTRTVQQVRLLELPGAPADLGCRSDLSPWTGPALAPPTGTMAARAQQSSQSTIDLCTPTPAGGFRGLENQLYRVQVHDVTANGDPVVVWSRDNASVVTTWTGSVGNELTVGDIGKDAVLGFAAGQWVELIDEGRILAGTPGSFVRVLGAAGTTITIDAATATGPIDHGEFTHGVALVRRWDSPGPVVAALGEWLELEDGVQIRFSSAGTFRPGDYWLVAARTATADVEWPRDDEGAPQPRPPLGIEHAWAPLAVVRIDAGGTTVTDCRVRFPSLTALTAEDVSFANDTCALPGAGNVQQALDRLCEARDLRRHHRLLHGWGIVCGLAVHCGPNPTGERRHVTVRSGTAIDVDGNDLDLTQDTTIDVMSKIEDLLQTDPTVLDDAGDGDVCLRVETDDALQVGFGIAKLGVSSNDAATLLQGTLLLDFYNDCIKSLHDWLRDQLVQPDGDQSPASPARQRLAVLTNLVAQPLNPKSGRNIHVSAREDELLQTFYAGLRERLQSETFCAMFEGARTPPAHPSELTGIDTIFGTGSHTRLRVRPGGTEAYTVGAGLSPLKPVGLINRYDLRQGRLVARIDPIAGKEVEPGVRADTDSGSGAVTDVAFSQDGKLIFATIPTRSEDDTVFRVGEIAAGTIRWRPPVTICGVKLVTLATTAADPDFVYAIGLRKVTSTSGNTSVVRWHGKGIYRINPAAVDPNIEPLAIPDFFPVGHLEIAATGVAVATAVRADQPVTAYDQLVQLTLPPGAARATLPRIDLPSSGNDDLTITMVDGRIPLAYVVVNRGQDKVVIGREVGNGAQIGGDDAVVQQGPGAVRLLGLGESVAVTLADSYGAKLVGARDAALVNGHFVPLQVGPISAAFVAQRTGRLQRAYVLNYVSNTVSAIDVRLLQPDARFDLAALAAYRKAMLEAYADLLAGFVQYVKDCFFDHFVVRCPQPTGDEVIELACISIRGKQVYKVCNFSRRRYVKSFPTVEYWLSAVPVLPALKLAFSTLACQVLAPTFAKFEVGDDGDDRVSVHQLQQLLAWAQSGDLLGRARELRSRAGATTTAAGFALSRMTPSPPAGPTVVGSDLVGQRGEQAAGLLVERGLSVQRAPFTGTVAAGSLADVANLVRQPAPGDQVTLFEDDDGAVRHFTVTKGGAAGVSAPAGDVAARLAALEQELADLRTRLVPSRTRATAPAAKKTPAARKRSSKPPER